MRGIVTNGRLQLARNPSCHRPSREPPVLSGSDAPICRFRVSLFVCGSVRSFVSLQENSHFSRFVPPLPPPKTGRFPNGNDAVDAHWRDRLWASTVHYFQKVSLAGGRWARGKKFRGPGLRPQPPPTGYSYGFLRIQTSPHAPPPNKAPRSGSVGNTQAAEFLRTANAPRVHSQICREAKVSCPLLV